jgi:hypothetical protein
MGFPVNALARSGLVGICWAIVWRSLYRPLRSLTEKRGGSHGIQLALALSLSALTGCDVHNEKLVGPYILIAVDTTQQMSVGYSLGNGGGIGRIEPVVFAVGWNDRYIVAKQHPKGDRSVTRFYYLDMAKDEKYPTGGQLSAVAGPLTGAQFAEAQVRLGLPDFKRVIKELE